jgi:Sulfotransferase family
MICHRHHAIFIHIPKTAGTSIEQKFGLYDIPTWGAQDHRTVREIRPLSLFRHSRYLVNPSSLQGFSRYTMLRDMLGVSGKSGPHGRRASRNEFASYLKFAVVRNPWARIQSWYRNMMRDPLHGVPPCDFASFLVEHAANWALSPQTNWITDFDGSIPLNRVVRFENLADEMSEVLRDLGFRDRTLPHLLKEESRTDYRAAYNDSQAEWIAERYRDEIRLFGYAF